MPRPTFERPYQPKNKPHGGGVRPEEGRAVDFRTTLGCYMQSVVELYAEAEGISQSAWVRNVIRDELARRGTVFK